MATGAVRAARPKPCHGLINAPHVGLLTVPATRAEVELKAGLGTEESRPPAAPRNTSLLARAPLLGARPVANSVKLWIFSVSGDRSGCPAPDLDRAPQRVVLITAPSGAGVDAINVLKDICYRYRQPCRCR